MPLQDDPIDPATVLAELDDIASPATVASTGGRFFGFVIGGCLPAPMAVNMWRNEVAGALHVTDGFTFLSLHGAARWE